MVNAVRRGQPPSTQMLMENGLGRGLGKQNTELSSEELVVQRLMRIRRFMME